MSNYFAYSSPVHMRGVQKNWELAEGEVLFDHEPTIVELEAAFGIETGGVERERQAAQERARRDVKLSSLLWLRDRHRDQLDISVDTTLTSDQFAELLVYMQALRDWPQSADFPDAQHRPTAPQFLESEQ